MAYASGKKRRGSRRARRAATIVATVAGALWFLLGYAAFEQIKPLARQSLLVQIGAFIAIGLGVVVVSWLLVRLVAPVFYRRRSSPLDLDKSLERALAHARALEPKADPGENREQGAGPTTGN